MSVTNLWQITRHKSSAKNLGRIHSIARRGIYILYEDVKSCPYEDVHVLWSILVESQPKALQLPLPLNH
ncbi:hypothetical protein KFK09_021253 [Dendrobium nobile]|uniref:Uncharacterized protein n=1 Tax=Dendrobium nobile TaxID=94219 RepID=A0A8T3APM1_DENNO|nr:hypothetical protein KFK09_021252 [Dendrobium nobile]KAI0498012.1 hypothetical protein KFK09_021253 [Dendrobium nobile]